MPSKPKDVPTTPDKVYQNDGWAGFKDWLGTEFRGGRGTRWRPFVQAREFTRKLGLLSESEWRKYALGKLPHLRNKPMDIPASPATVYREKGWKNWPDWLGNTRKPADYRFKSFKEARNFMRSLNLKNQHEWSEWVKGRLPNKPSKPEDIPTNPHRTYKNEWQGYKDWLGSENVLRKRKVFRPFIEAQEYAQSLNLKNRAEWEAHCKENLKRLGRKPEDIPSQPNTVFREQWQGWGDWLGTNHRKGGWMSFKEARKYVHKLGLNNRNQWAAYCSGRLPNLPLKPSNIPKTPWVVYRSKWISMGDWLGTGRIVD
jgi:hypothetical protein